MQPSKLTSFLKSLSSPAGWKAAAVGAAGALGGYFIAGITLGPFFDFSLNSNPGFWKLLLGQSLMFGIEGMLLSLGILAWNNHTSLRGRWQRDLLPGAALFAAIAILSGGIGQLLYSLVPLTRAFPWLLAGAGIGAAIGLLRRDKDQAMRGALGGAIGGLAGGITVDLLLAISYTDNAFALGSLAGVIVTGAMIALFMHAVQHAMQSAWLMGTSTGPYEGKEYPLGSMQTTVGQTELNDIALYRDRSVPARAGKILFENGRWRWQSDSGETPALIDGQPATSAELQPGSRLQLGDTHFVFLTREEMPEAAPNLPMAPTLRGWQLLHPVAPLQIGLDGMWTIGRSPENALVLADAAVSSRHACIEVRAGVPAIVDTGSTNGSFVNGARLTPNLPVRLRDGDRLTLGQTEFVVRPI
jgi:hypothetical protein